MQAAFDGGIQVQAGGRFRLVGRGIDVTGGKLASNAKVVKRNMKSFLA